MCPISPLQPCRPREDLAVEHDRATDADLAGDVDEAGRRRARAPRRVRRGWPRWRARRAAVSRRRASADDVDVAPAEVRRDAQRSGDAVDEPGQREHGAGDARRRRPASPRPRRRARRAASSTAAGSVPRRSSSSTRSASTSPDEVEHADPEVVDVDLHAERRRRSRAAATSGTAGRPARCVCVGLELARRRPRLDQLVDQPGDRAAGQPGWRRRRCGAGRRAAAASTMVRSATAEVLVAHLPCRAARSGSGSWLDPSRLRAINSSGN